MPESINSVSPDFRDFLLNRNLISDTVTQNGLQSLLIGIGVPITNIGTPMETVMASTNIEEDGDVYKDLNLVNNKFQGTDFDYERRSINNLASTSRVSGPPPTAFAYSPYYTANYGILNETLNTPATGPFQGGDIRQFNTSFNLYDDPAKRLLVDLNNVSAPNVKYTNYIDLNAGIDKIGINLLGSILGGRGIGIGNGSTLVPDFDLRATLVGRVLGGTGVISDTPLGQAGAKYLALALANNAAFGLQQETIGHLNLNPLSIAMNGIGSIIVPNYDITVPKSTVGRVLNFAAKVLGFESPISLYKRESSIFASENPVGNITRAQEQIQNSGKGQVLSLFANLKQNKFIPKYEDKRVKSASNRAIDTGTNGKLYAFEDGTGGIQDLLNVQLEQEDNSNETVNEDEYTTQSDYLAGLKSGFESTHGKITSELDGIATGPNTNFDEDTFSTISQYGEDGGLVNQYIWGDTKNNAPGKRVFIDDRFKKTESLLYKTQSLFKTGKMRTLTSGKVVIKETKSDIQSAVRTGGFMSKGSGVLSQTALQGQDQDTGAIDSSLDAENIFCRTWTTFDRYNQVQDLQKNTGINGRTAFRNDFEDSVLDSNGFVKIAPYIGDDQVKVDGTTDIKNFMFSIENLAWADDHQKLLSCEIGPGDLMTGKKGRIMWFPPYDITISENTSIDWSSTNFIGRGEPIYTYNNTERTATLQFKIVVDHPSYLNALKSESDDYIASYFAGCTEINEVLAKKLTTLEKSQIVTKNVKAPVKKGPTDISPSIKSVSFYFPNDVATLNLEYEDENGSGGLGNVMSEGIVAPKRNYVDKTDFGLNAYKNPELGSDGGWLFGADVIKKVLNEDCQACKMKITGWASIAGGAGSSKNQELSEKRAESVKQFFINSIIDETQEIYGSNGITVEERFEFVNGEGTTDSPPCPQLFEPVDESDPNYNPNAKPKRKDTSDVFGCKVNRKVDVEIVFDQELQNKINKEDVIVEEPLPVEDAVVSQEIINRFYNECNYFEKLSKDDPVVYSSIKQKLKFFHPAFHAITPEGLNSRLTFLHQCTRQGPTNLVGKPDNLAFGRPPICILRLGDFYHTKIVIDNMNISYEPLVWDLNPEGIGVQPMIATVDLSFKIVGGQSMKGPINKLQNAVSFNFFGNTQVYEARADKISKVSELSKSLAGAEKGLKLLIEPSGTYALVPGLNVLEDSRKTMLPEEETLSDDAGSKNQVDESQVDTTEVSDTPPATTATTATTINNNAVIKAIKIKSAKKTIVDGEEVIFDIVYSFTPSDDAKTLEVDKKMTGNIYIAPEQDGVGGTPPPLKSIGEITIGPNTAGQNVEIKDTVPNEPRDITVPEFTTEITVYDESIVEFFSTWEAASIQLNVQWDNKARTKRQRFI